MSHKWTSYIYMDLTLLFIIPCIAVINLVFIKESNVRTMFRTSLFYSMLQVSIFSLFLVEFDNFCEFQFTYKFNWVNLIGSSYSWGPVLFMADGISLIFVGLSTLLIPVCILTSWKSIKYLQREFLICLFSVSFLLMGVFTVMDLLGFYILFEATLIPMFLIIGIWGPRKERVKAAYYFIFYTLVGSLLMLVDIFKIYSLLGVTNYLTLITIDIPGNTQMWLFLGFFFSLATKIPMYPFHLWLPQAHAEAPISGSILLAGVLLKLGGYGFIRFSYPIFPIASDFFSPIIITLSIISIVMGALTTLRQTDLKRLIAYSSISHMGLVTLAIFSHTLEGLVAALTMMVAHGLVSSGLFIVSSILYTRFYTRTIKYFRGLSITMPVLSTITFILMLGNISFPTTLNFIAEFLSLVTAINYSYTTGMFVSIGIFLGTVYSLYIYNRMYFGSPTNCLMYPRDISLLEFNSLIPLIALILVLGIFPNTLINLIIGSCLMNISL